MNKLHQLFIRACKSKNPNRRILSVYRRYYVRYGMYEDHRADIMNILVAVVDTYTKMTVANVIDRLNPDHGFLDKDMIYIDRVIEMCISKIRFTNTEDLVGLTAPCKFRPRSIKVVFDEA